MLAIIISSFMILGFFISYLLVMSKWNYYKSDPLGFRLHMLRSENVLTRIWPVDDNFMSLHFSMSRHMVFGILSISIIYFFPSSLISSIMSTLNLLYALSKLPLYNARRKEFINRSNESRQVLAPVKQACFITVIYGFYVYILTFVFYGIRP